MISEHENIFSREITLEDAWRILSRRRSLFMFIVLGFLSVGFLISLTVGTPVTVSCLLKTAYMPPGSGPETIDEVNERVLKWVRTAEPGSPLLAGCDRLDYSLWQQTVSFVRIGKSRTLQISGRTFTEGAAVKLASAAAEALQEENDKAVADALRIGRLRLSELRLISAASGKISRGRSPTVEGLKDFVQSVSAWSVAEAQKAAIELDNIGSAEVVSAPSITRVAALFNRAMISALFAFLGAVAALIFIFWMEVWRNASPRSV